VWKCADAELLVIIFVFLAVVAIDSGSASEPNG
jgi:hypothetical protein